MLKTFNLGAGLVMVVKPEAKTQIIRHMNGFGVSATEIGEIQKGADKVALTGNLAW